MPTHKKNNKIVYNYTNITINITIRDSSFFITTHTHTHTQCYLLSSFEYTIASTAAMTSLFLIVCTCSTPGNCLKVTL